MASIGKLNDAKEIISLALELYPRNLMLNQFQIDLKEKRTSLYLIAKRQIM